jgi:hypothetical protein
MDQAENNAQDLTPEQQHRKDVWSGALERAGIPADTMDWKQADPAAPLYSQDSEKEKTA